MSYSNDPEFVTHINKKIKTGCWLREKSDLYYTRAVYLELQRNLCFTANITNSDTSCRQPTVSSGQRTHSCRLSASSPSSSRGHQHRTELINSNCSLHIVLMQGTRACRGNIGNYSCVHPWSLACNPWNLLRTNNSNGIRRPQVRPPTTSIPALLLSMPDEPTRPPNGCIVLPPCWYNNN